MEAQEPIDHVAVVCALQDGKSAEVVISDSEGCDTCAAAKFCHAAGGNEKTILTADVAPGLELRPGDRVLVRGTESIHRKAIMLATVIPCIALILVMVLVYLLTLSQGTAALAGLGSMVLFFLLLYFFRNRLAGEFRFTIVSKVKENAEPVK